MKKQNNRGLGSFIYTEWLFPIVHYYSSLQQNERIFEVVAPVIVSIACTIVYGVNNKLSMALFKLVELLPTVVSILIGFTVMLITLLLTSSGESIDRLRKTKSSNKISGREISLYQRLHIQFSHTLFSEIFLMLLVFLYLFLTGIGICCIVEAIFLLLIIYLILNILLSVLRGTANIYFSFYNFPDE